MASLLARWPKPAQPTRAPSPSPRLRPRPRVTAGRAVPPWRASRALPPRSAHAPAWTRPGRPPGAPGRARLPLRCHSRSSTLPLSLSRLRSTRASHRRRHWSPELRSSRSFSTCEPFFDSSFPELRARFAIAGHTSERLVTHGEPCSPSLSCPARAPSPHMWLAHHRALLRLLASTSRSPLHHEAPRRFQSHSTGPAPRVDSEPRHRSAMAGGELGPVHPRSHIDAHRGYLES